MIRSFPLFLLVLTTTSCNAQEPTINASSPVKTENQSHSANTSHSTISLKDSASSWELGIYNPIKNDTTALPLIVYLHGGIGTERTDKGAKAWEMFQFITDSFPAILVSPSANRYAPWWSKTGLARIFTAVEMAKQKFLIDTTKIFLAGVSDGATGLFAVAAKPDHPFAGFIGASGNPTFYNNALTPKQLARTPIHLFIAGKDHLYPATNIQLWCDSMITHNVPLTYSIKADAVHGFDFKYDEKTQIISYFKTWKRK